MKISCQSCQAKYTIADEKVLGKVVKIRCKKCGATIVINGNEAHASAEGGGDQVFDYTAGAGSEQWTVNVNDGDQRTLTVQEVVAEYLAGVINDETFCWKDGMGDWLPLREIASLHGECSGGLRPSLSPEVAAPAYGAPHDPMASLATRPMEQHETGGGGIGALFGSSDAGATEENPTHGNNGNGQNGGIFGDASPAAPAAARRQGGRGGGGADLFGGVAQAGGEEDVMTSAPVGPPPSHGGDPGKLTGQRNENSVLFALSALTEKGEKEEAPGPQGDGSGLIDIRALSANMSANKPAGGSSHVDDIMNLGGGGAFSAALAAPILAPPPMGGSDASLGQNEDSGKKKMLLFAGIGGVVFLLMLATIIVLVTRKPAETASTMPGNTASGMGSAMVEPTATNPALAMNDTPPAASGATPTSKDPVAAAPGTGNAPVKNTPPKPAGGPVAPKPTNPVFAGTAPDPASPPATPAPHPAAGGGSLEEELRRASGPSGAGNTPAPAAASTAQFDRGAAAASLGAVNVGACKKGDGPTGSGHVSVTFAPTGSVVSAVVDGPPFAGTPVGGCVAGKFRGARVPAFGGGNVKVGKSFSIN